MKSEKKPYPTLINRQQQQVQQYPQQYPNSIPHWDQQLSHSKHHPSIRYDQSIFIEDLRELIPLIVYTILALGTRLYKIGSSKTVIWDEAHFGKFGGFYLNQTFYFDVHPPLAKMMVGLAGFLTGFDGTFDFPSGQLYPDHVPFRTMRILLALPGVALVPIAWATALELGFTTYTRHIVTLMVLADLSWTVISRFILLDSMLLFFTFTTVYCLVCFENQRRYPFDFEWWFWLSMTGLSVGCVTSVKWVGLFVTALVGFHTAEDLWEKFGDLRMPYRVYARHWVARIVCLIGLPIMVYMLCFKIHFLILNRSGPGDAQMSSLFQANLWGNDFARHPLEIAVGSRVTFKNMGYGGGLLHSHVQTFPVGSQQQQVTCYHYRDSNNEWTITPLLHEEPYNESQPIRFLKHGDIVRLVHKMTGRNLHTHEIPAPITKINKEVACYGNATIDDSNSYWVIEVVDDILRGKKERFQNINTLSTRLRIRHLNLGCYLRAANAVLPQWGFKQVEVSCDKKNNPKDKHTYWNVESHMNGRLPPGDMKVMKSPFLHDFWHLNIAMMTSNNALIPDPDKQDAIASHPFEWPLLYTGMRMNGWFDHGIKFYLIGNPITWWISFCSLLLYSGALVWYLARFKRQHNDLSLIQWYQFIWVGKVGLGGWLLHYLPFLFMGRVTYLHHYLPTLWFAIITSGLCFDHFIFRSKDFNQVQKKLIFWSLAALITFTGIWFRDCAWGIEGPINKYKGRQWRKSWNIYDDHLGL
ncbi:family 39 glycosyltransferase [Melampsora americana]|nr:family 39 glycosyltransferase [Melampsora americana]